MAAGTRSPEKNEHGDDVKTPQFPIDRGAAGDASDPRGNGGAGYGGPASDDQFEKMQDLQKSYDAENSDYDPDDPRSKAASRSDLNDQEQGAGSSSSSAGDTGSGSSSAVGNAEQALQDRIGAAEEKGKEKRAEGGLYGGKEKPGQFGGGLGSLKGQLKKYARQQIVIAAAVGIIGGGIIYGFAVLSGPGQFIQMAKLLEGFHLGTNQDVFDNRFIKQARYIYYASRPDNPVVRVRLGYFGNKVADKIETRVAERTGFVSDYKNGRGRYIIDPQKLAGTQYDGFKDRPVADLRAHLERTNPGVPVTIDNGKAIVGTEGLNARQERRLIKSTMDSAGYRKFTQSINFRIIGQRHGATFHPIRKADRAIEKETIKRFEAWKAKRAARINNGDSIRGGGIPGDTEAGREASATGKEADDAKEAAKNGDTTKLDDFRGSIGGKVTGSSLALTGVACLLRDVDNASAGLKQAQVMEPMIRMFSEVLSLGSQGMSGDDLTIEQMGYYSKQLKGKDSQGNKSSFNNSESWRSEQGKKGGVPPTATVKDAAKDSSPFSFTNEGELGTVLDGACGPFGIAVQTTLGIVTGGAATTVVGGFVSFFTTPLIIAQAAEWLAGNAVNPFAAGADFGNITNYGGRMMANSQMISAGGRELDPAEETQIDTLAAAGAEEDFRSRSFAARTFDINETKSLASTVAFSAPTEIQASLTGAFSDPFKTVGSSWFAQKLIGTKALAQNPSQGVDYDYGFKQFGFSQTELEDKRIDNPYENADIVINQILPRYDNCGTCFENNSRIERVRDCFGVHIDSTKDIVSFNKYKGDEPPNPTKLPPECSEQSEEWMRIRFYVIDTQVMSGAACYEDTEASEEACALVAADVAGSGGAGTTTGSTAGTGAPAGSANIIKLDNPIPGSSCNCEIEPKGVTLHWWGDKYGRGIAGLTDIFKDNGLSVQLGITSDGKTYQLTDKLNTQANHAIGGNESTIGIEIEGGPSDFGKEGIEKYPEKFEAVVATVQYLKDKYNIPLKKTIGCDSTANKPSGILQHGDFNACPKADSKSDIDDYYYGEVIKRVR